MTSGGQLMRQRTTCL